MMKTFLMANLVSALLVLVASVQVHGFVPFDFESEFPQDLPETQNFPESNEVTSLFPEPELSQDSQETQNFPEKTSQVSENKFPKEFEYPVEYFEAQQVPYKTDALREVKSRSPSSATAVAEGDKACLDKCSLKCRNEEFSLLLDLCNQVCKTDCLTQRSVSIYNCTSSCAKSMPGDIKSDKKKADAYVDNCLSECLKKF